LPKLSPVPWKELLRRLRKLGFEGPYQGGKHPYMIRGDVALTIPNPHRSEVSVDLLKKILRRAEVSRKDWESVE